MDIIILDNLMPATYGGAQGGKGSVLVKVALLRSCSSTTTTSKPKSQQWPLDEKDCRDPCRLLWEHRSTWRRLTLQRSQYLLLIMCTNASCHSLLLFRFHHGMWETAMGQWRTSTQITQLKSSFAWFSQIWPQTYHSTVGGKPRIWHPRQQYFKRTSRPL